MSKTSVAITGMGAVSPLGLSTEDLWEGLSSGRSGIARITAFDPSHFPCQIAGQVPDYKLRDFIPKTYRKAAKLMCRDIELAVIAADQAIRQSGLVTQAIDPDNVTIDPERIGVNLGAGLICWTGRTAAPFRSAPPSTRPSSAQSHRALSRRPASATCGRSARARSCSGSSPRVQPLRPPSA